MCCEVSNLTGGWRLLQDAHNSFQVTTFRSVPSISGHFNLDSKPASKMSGEFVASDKPNAEEMFFFFVRLSMHHAVLVQEQWKACCCRQRACSSQWATVRRLATAKEIRAKLEIAGHVNLFHVGFRHGRARSRLPKRIIVVRNATMWEENKLHPTNGNWIKISIGLHHYFWFAEHILLSPRFFCLSMNLGAVRTHGISKAFLLVFTMCAFWLQQTAEISPRAVKINLVLEWMCVCVCVSRVRHYLSGGSSSGVNYKAIWHDGPKQRFGIPHSHTWSRMEAATEIPAVWRLPKTGISFFLHLAPARRCSETIGSNGLTEQKKKT